MYYTLQLCQKYQPMKVIQFWTLRLRNFVLSCDRIPNLRQSSFFNQAIFLKWRSTQWWFFILIWFGGFIYFYSPPHTTLAGSYFGVRGGCSNATKTTSFGRRKTPRSSTINMVKEGLSNNLYNVLRVQYSVHRATILYKILQSWHRATASTITLPASLATPANAICILGTSVSLKKLIPTPTRPTTKIVLYRFVLRYIYIYKLTISLLLLNVLLEIFAAGDHSSVWHIWFLHWLLCQWMTCFSQN